MKRRIVDLTWIVVGALYRVLFVTAWGQAYAELTDVARLLWGSVVPLYILNKALGMLAVQLREKDEQAPAATVSNTFNSRPLTPDQARQLQALLASFDQPKEARPLN